MPTCSVKREIRSAVALGSNPVLDAAYSPVLFAAGLQAVRRKFPNLSVTEVWRAEDRRFGWVESGRMVLNMARPSHQTALHEASHVALAVVMADNPNYIQYLLRELDGSRAHRSVRERYPVSDSYSYQDQLLETAAHLLGNVNERRLGALVSGSIWQRLALQVRDALIRLTGVDPAADGLSAMFNLKVNRILHSLATDFLSGQASALSAEHLAALLPGTYDLRSSGPEHLSLPGTVDELLTALTGRASGPAPLALERRIQAMMARWPGQTFEYYAADGSVVTGNYDSLDGIARERQLAGVLKDASTSSRAGLMEKALDVLGGKPLLAPDSDEERHAQSRFMLALDQAFPDRKDNDRIVAYGADTTPEIYSADYDTGNILVRVSEREQQGRMVKVYDLVAVTPEGLTVSKDDKGLLHGISGGGLLGAARSLLGEWALGTKMPGSNRTRQEMAVTLLAMHIKHTGAGVTDNLTVAKFSLKRSSQDQNHVVQVYPTEHLQTIRQLRTLPIFQEHVKGLSASATAMLANEALYDPDSYQRDYNRYLLAAYERVDRRDQIAVREALGEYESDRQAASMQKLNRAIQARLTHLRRSLGDDKLYHESPEVRLLGRVQMRLAGVSELLNPHKEVGMLERFTRPFNAGYNAYSQFLYEHIFTTRRQVSEAYLKFQDEHSTLLDAFRKEYEASNPGTAASTLAGMPESRYYKTLLVHGQYDVYDPATKTTSQVEINEHRLHLPGSAGYEKLGPAARAYSDFLLANTRKQLVARYKLQNPNKTDEQVSTWFESNWGEGKLPVTRGSAASNLFNGQLLAATGQQVEDWLGENSVYDRNDNPDSDTLSDMYALQGGSGRLGSAARVGLLGLKVDDAWTGSETRYIVDEEGGLNRARRTEEDLRKSTNAFMMNQLKLQLMNNLENTFHTSLALLHAREDEQGTLRGNQGEKGRDGSPRMSRDEQDLRAMYRMLYLQQKQQGSGTAGVRRAASMLALIGKGTTFGALAFNTATAVNSFAANATNIVTNSLANWGGQNGFDAKDLGFGVKALTTETGKLYAIAKQTGLLKLDEFDLLHDRFFNKERLQATDAGEVAFFLDQVGDTALRLYMVAMQMHKHGTWEAYSFDAATNTLTYDESKDPRSQAVKDATREQLILEGVLPAGAGLDRAYDSRMLRTMESYVTDSLGGYKDEVSTLLATIIAGKALRKFRVFLVNKLHRYFQKGHYNPNRLIQDPVTGEYISEFEEGLLISLAGWIGRTAHYGGRGIAAYKEMKPEQQRNLRLLSVNIVGAVSLGLLVGAFGDDDEKKKGAQRKRNVIDTVINELSLVDAFRSGVSVLESPFVAVNYMTKLGDLMLDVVHGDLDAATRKGIRQFGAAKTYQMVGGWFSEEQELQ